MDKSPNYMESVEKLHNELDHIEQVISKISEKDLSKYRGQILILKNKLTRVADEMDTEVYRGEGLRGL